MDARTNDCSPNGWLRPTLLAAGCLAALFVGQPAQAKMSVVSSPHNLSASGGVRRTSGQPSVSFTEETRVCVFCHVPHNAKPGTPLWSRDLPSDALNYQLYQSSTLNATSISGKPTGSSRLCLSCHDGTIALGQYAGSPISRLVYMPSDSNPASNANLTIDLRDDHPISLEYNDALAQRSHLASPTALGPAVRLETGGFLQCTACHDPHDNQYGNFLVMNNSSPDRPNYQPGSPLCVTCHKPDGWGTASHNPVRTPTLANACLNCHAVHSAPGRVRLLKTANMEDTCYLSCHNGTDPTSVNVQSLFGTGMHRHPVGDLRGAGVHDEKESLPAQTYHVQCVDCHNPHQLNGDNKPLSSAPFIDGRIKGVRKNDLGDVATTEYDVCFKCHSGGNASKFAGITEIPPNRVINEPDEANRFDVLNPSFHPVTADRRTTGASLLAEYQPTMVRIYCTDCHNSSLGTKAGGSGANGPHGSQYEHILIAQYDMPAVGTSRPSYNKSLYALCFRCHSEDYVMGVGSKFSDAGGAGGSAGTLVNEHQVHVSGQQIPCFVCHDPHGVGWKMGGTAANNAHLINFDRYYASGPLVATPVYNSAGPGSGDCTVNCHTNSGGNHAYANTVAAKMLRRLKRTNSLKIR